MANRFALEEVEVMKKYLEEVASGHTQHRLILPIPAELSRNVLPLFRRLIDFGIDVVIDPKDDTIQAPRRADLLLLKNQCIGDENTVVYLHASLSTFEWLLVNYMRLFHNRP